MKNTNSILKGGISSRATGWMLITTSVVLITRLFWFAYRYSVNILYFDQWAFYSPLFNYENLWQLFTWQHGPHRQGIGLILTKFLADSTRWNTKIDSLATVALLSIAMILAFVLKHKLWRSFTLWDLIIPFLFLTLFQYEAIVVVANLSYGAFPIVMVMLYSLILLMPNRKIVRYSILLALNFMLIYTGWGLFMGIITIILLLVEFYISLKTGRDQVVTGMAVLVAIGSQLSFFIDYRIDPAVSCFGLSTTYIAQYPIFVGLMLSAFFGWHIRFLGTLAIPAGLALLTIAIYVLAYHGRQIVKQGLYTNKVSLVITILISYSLLFCMSTAIGRVCTGLQLAQVSRYMTLLVPLFLAIYFHLVYLKQTRLSIFILISYIAIASLGSLPLGIIEGIASKTYVSKTEWKSCYLQTYDIDSCNQITNFEIYPFKEQLPEKLEYLKTYHLNLFVDSP